MVTKYHELCLNLKLLNTHYRHLNFCCREKRTAFREHLAHKHQAACLDVGELKQTQDLHPSCCGG